MKEVRQDREVERENIDRRVLSCVICIRQSLFLKLITHGRHWTNFYCLYFFIPALPK